MLLNPPWNRTILFFFSNELFSRALLNEPRRLEYMDVVTFVVGPMLKLRKGCDISSTQTHHREGTQAKVSAVTENKNVNNNPNNSKEEGERKSHIGHHPGNDIQPWSLIWGFTKLHWASQWSDPKCPVLIYSWLYAKIRKMSAFLLRRVMIFLILQIHQHQYSNCLHIKGAAFIRSLVQFDAWRGIIG